MRLPDNLKQIHAPSQEHVILPKSGARATVDKGADPELLQALDNMAMKAKNMRWEDPFVDVHGNVVHSGCKIRIIRHYSTEKLVNQHATVIWNAKQGMYMFTYTEEVAGKKRIVTLDFYGVHEFEITAAAPARRPPSNSPQGERGSDSSLAKP